MFLSPERNDYRGGGTMNKLLMLIALVVLMTAIVLAGCSSQAPTAKVTADDTTKPIKIGMLAPMTGEASSYGVNVNLGALLAVKEINEAGGIDGRKIEYILEDDECSSKSVAAMTKLINVDKVDVIVGPVCSAAAGPALPIAQQNKVPVVLTAASAPALTSVGDYIFRIYPSDALQGKFGADFAYDRLGKKAAILYVQNDWGEGLYRVFKDRFTKLGGKVVFESSALGTDTDFKTIISQIKDSGADFLYLPLYPNSGAAATKQAKELGLDIQILGADAYVAEEIIKSGNADGVIYTVVDARSPKEFEQRIATLPEAKNVDQNFITMFGYDAIKVAANAIARAGTTNKQAVRDALATTNYVGVSNPSITFDSVGDLTSTKVGLRIIKDKTAQVYK